MTTQFRETVLSHPHHRHDGIPVFFDQDRREHVLIFEAALQAMLGEAALGAYRALGRDLPLTRFVPLDCVGDPSVHPGADKALQWLVDNSVVEDRVRLWRHEFDLYHPTAGMLRSPWPSAFSQAFVLLAFLAWHRYHPTRVNDGLIREIAGVFVRDNIISSVLGDGIWFQEYPFAQPTFVLNAHLLALVALAESARVLNDTAIRERISLGVQALCSRFPLFDRGCWSRYDLESQGHIFLRITNTTATVRSLILSVTLRDANGYVLAEGSAQEFDESADYQGPFQGADWHLDPTSEAAALCVPYGGAGDSYLRFANLAVPFEQLQRGLVIDLAGEHLGAIKAFSRDPRSEALVFLEDELRISLDPGNPQRARIELQWEQLGPPLPFHYHLFHCQTARELARLLGTPAITAIAHRLEQQLLGVAPASDSVRHAEIETNRASQRRLRELEDANQLLVGYLSDAQRKTERLASTQIATEQANAYLRQALSTAKSEASSLRSKANDLSLLYQEAADALAMRRGVRGGAREFARSLRHKLIRGPLETPCQVFSEPWRPLDIPAPPAGAARRVLVFSHMFPHPDQPSSGPFIHEQVKALRNHAGIDARVVVGRPFWMMHRNPIRVWNSNRVFWRYFKNCLRWWDYDGVPVAYLPYRIFGPWFTQGWSYRASAMAAFSWIRRDFDFDLVHAHTGYLDGSAGLGVSQAAHVPMVITEHTGPFSLLMRNPLVRRFTLRALRAARRIVVVSRAQGRDVTSHLSPRDPSQVVVLPNVVDTELFRVSFDRPPDPAAPRIVFVGYFVPIKQLPFLLDAFVAVQKSIAGATLRLVGGGENREQETELEREIARRGLAHCVIVQGHQSREQVARIMRRECDVLVLCSKSETFGCVLTEALASGKPVVATRCGGPEDIITSDDVGVLCENGNPQILADAILRVVLNHTHYEPARIRAYAESRFGFATVANQIADLYAEVIEGRAAGVPGTTRQ